MGIGFESVYKKKKIICLLKLGNFHLCRLAEQNGIHHVRETTVRKPFGNVNGYLLATICSVQIDKIVCHSIESCIILHIYFILTKSDTHTEFFYFTFSYGQFLLLEWLLHGKHLNHFLLLCVAFLHICILYTSLFILFLLCLIIDHQYDRCHWIIVQTNQFSWIC